MFMGKEENNMAFCTNCGASLGEGQKFCTNCGTPVELPSAADSALQAAAAETAVQAADTAFETAPQPLPQQPPQAPAVPEYRPEPAAPGSQLNYAPEGREAFRPEDIARNKGMGVLAYLGLLVLIPIFAAKESAFARFHANQGLVLLVCEFAFWIVGKVFDFVGTLGGIFTFVLAVIGIINAVRGQAKELPVVGRVRLLK